MSGGRGRELRVWDFYKGLVAAEKSFVVAESIVFIEIELVVVVVVGLGVGERKRVHCLT